MTIKMLTLGVVSAAAIAATSPALAENGKGPYVAFEGGISVAPKNKIDTVDPKTTPKPVQDGITIKNKAGGEFGIIGGYDFGPIRTEIELSQKSNGVDRVDSLVHLPTKFNTAPAAPTLALGAFPNATGSTRSKSAMLNVIGDIGSPDGVNFFVGGGLGVADVSARNYSVSKDAKFLNDSDKGFAWQLMTGVRVPLNETIELGVKYNYFRATGIDMVDALKRKLSMSQTSHGVRATVGFKF